MIRSGTAESMGGRIRVLDDALIDQIAAGEVVERPASVVKELLENALDAQASNITVEIEDGGRALIRVVDDGVGMSPTDATLAVRRHATSKLRSVEDLDAIRTLGFRGEALPSIASVSKFRLTTRTADAVEATRVVIDGTKAPEVRPSGAAKGTAVEVRDLFFNVPARRKFLKSRQSEARQIGDVVLRAALAHPELRLTLVSNGKRHKAYLPTEDLVARARGTLGPDLSPIEGERDGLRIVAALSAPEKARSGAARLFLFINGRPIKDRTLARSVAFSYGSVLPPGRFPSGVVHLFVDPADVDVNAHPQKTEVRFAGGRAVLDQLTRLLASRLGTQAWGRPTPRSESYWQERLGGQGSAPAESSGYEARPVDIDRESPSPASAADALAAALRDAGPLAYQKSAVASEGHAPTAPGLLPTKGFFGQLRVLGQVRRLLIVCEGPDALYLLDQHAADERVRFAQLSAAYAERSVAVQRLLFPERVEVVPSEAALIEEQREALLAVGLDCALLGPTTAAVHAVPALVSRAPAERLLGDVLAELGRTGERAFGDAIDMALATMACHGAIRAGDTLSPEECTALLRSLDEVESFAGHCPHGRPVVTQVPFAEVERKLGR